MRGRQIVGAILGVFVASLGLLWLLQGTGVLRIRPILCIANCEEVVGPSPFWAAAGAVVLIVGVIVAIVSVKRGRTP